jgi:hypothetical protein
MFPCNTKVSLLSCVFTTHSVFFNVVFPVGIVHDAVEVYCFTLFDLFVT